jgi:hypothetical protein
MNGTLYRSYSFKRRKTMSAGNPFIRHPGLSLIALLVFSFTQAGTGIGKGANDRGYWTPTLLLSPESTEDSFTPCVVLGPDGTLHVAWYDETIYGGSGSDWDIFYRSKPYGEDWTDVEVISTESRCYSRNPCLVIGQDGTVHAIWEDGTDLNGSGEDWDIFYKHKIPSEDWSITEVVSTEFDDHSLVSSAAIDMFGSIHVAWYDYTNYGDSGEDKDIYYKMRPVGGNWSDVELISTESTNSSKYPSLGVDAQGTAHVAWEDCTDYNGCGSDYDIFYKKRLINGMWTTTEVVSTESPGSSSHVAVFVEADGRVHVTWDDYSIWANLESDYYDIFYKLRSEDGEWTLTEVVSTEDTGWSEFPSIAVEENGTIHISWHASTNYGGSGRDWDVLYKMKPWGGDWTITEVVSTESNRASYHPRLTIGLNGWLHVVWHDFTDYQGCGFDYDIFTKQKSLDESQPPHAWGLVTEF